MLYLSWHTQHNKWKLVCFIFLSTCDSHVCSCYGCDRSLKIIMADRSKWIPYSLLNLVLITKMCPEYRKDIEFSHLSSVMYTSTHKWHKLFDLLALGKGQFKRNIYTNRPQNLANFEHTVCWVPNIYPEIGDQLVKSIKKVNWNTAVRTPYLTIPPNFDRKKSLHEFFFISILIKVYLDQLS